MQSKNQLRKYRKKRIKSKGTAKRPRAVVFRSAKRIYVQLIDDDSQKTIASASSEKIKSKKFDLQAAKETGLLLAKEAEKKKIREIIFDRSGYKYHGKVKSLAEGLREGGLAF
jgi:large subunit ribosomal protein L18